MKWIRDLNFYLFCMWQTRQTAGNCRNKLKKKRHTYCLLQMSSVQGNIAAVVQTKKLINMKKCHNKHNATNGEACLKCENENSRSSTQPSNHIQNIDTNKNSLVVVIINKKAVIRVICTYCHKSRGRKKTNKDFHSTYYEPTMRRLIKCNTIIRIITKQEQKKFALVSIVLVVFVPFICLMLEITFVWHIQTNAYDWAS